MGTLTLSPGILPPVVGRARFRSNGPVELLSSLDLISLAPKLLMIQCRTAPAPGCLHSFVRELIAWAKNSGITSVVLLTSSDSARRTGEDLRELSANDGVGIRPQIRFASYQSAISSPSSSPISEIQKRAQSAGLRSFPLVNPASLSLGSQSEPSEGDSDGDIWESENSASRGAESRATVGTSDVAILPVWQGGAARLLWHEACTSGIPICALIIYSSGPRILYEAEALAQVVSTVVGLPVPKAGGWPRPPGWGSVFEATQFVPSPFTLSFFFFLLNDFSDNRLCSINHHLVTGLKGLENCSCDGSLDISRKGKSLNDPMIQM